MKVLSLSPELCCSAFCPDRKLLTFLRRFFSFLWCWWKSTSIHRSSIWLILLPGLSFSLGEPLKLVPPPLASGGPNKRKKAIPSSVCSVFGVCPVLICCMWHGFMFLLKILRKNLVVAGKCNVTPVAAQFHRGHLCHEDTGTAYRRSMSSQCPLGRTVINLWLKGLRVF
jgi:hypothetical protein